MLFSSTLFKSHVLCNFTICLLPLLHSRSLSVSLLPSFVEHITLQSSYKIITDFPCACPNHLQNPFIYLFCNGTHTVSPMHPFLIVFFLVTSHIYLGYASHLFVVQLLIFFSLLNIQLHTTSKYATILWKYPFN